VPLLGKLSVHPLRNRDLRTAQRIFTTPDGPLFDCVYSFGNTGTRWTIRAGGITNPCGFVIENPLLPDPVVPDARRSAPVDPRRQYADLFAGQPLLQNRPPDRGSAGPVWASAAGLIADAADRGV